MSDAPAPNDLRQFREAVRRTVAGATRRGHVPPTAGRRLTLMLGRLPLEPRAEGARGEPAVRWLPTAMNTARRGPLAGLVRRMAPLVPHLSWIEEYAEEAITRDLREKYAHADVAARQGVLAAQGVRLGLVLLGPRAYYPAHAHAAEELYILLGGGAWWRWGATPWAWQPAGRMIHHPAHVSHAMRTGPWPVLAAYAWWGRIERPAAFLHRWVRPRTPGLGVTRWPGGRRSTGR